MPWSDSLILILAAEPGRRDAITVALQAAGLAARHEFVAELSDLVFAAGGRERALLVLDLYGQPPLPLPVSALLRRLNPGARLVAVDDGAMQPPGFDLAVPLAALAEGLHVGVPR